MKIINYILALTLVTGTLDSQNGGHSPIPESKHDLQGEFGNSRASSNSALNKIVFGYHPYWAAKDAYKSYDYSLITHLAYFSYEIDTATGGYTTLHGWDTTPLIEYARERNVKVILTVTNFGTAKNTAFLRDTNKQNRFIGEVISQLKLRNGGGINMDLESVGSSQKSNLVNFMRKLYKQVKAELPDAEISAASPAVDWSGSWDMISLAGCLDYFMIMCYDYYWPGAPNAGPVSPLEGGSYNVTNTINTYLEGGVPPGKILMGLPWYGVVWEVKDNTKNSKTVEDGISYTYNSMKSYAATHGRIFDETYQCPWFRYTEGDEYYQGWYDDSLSLALKYRLVNEKELLGIGIWAINYANGSSEIWNGIKQAFANTTAVTDYRKSEDAFILVRNNTLYYQPINNNEYTFEIFDILGNTVFKTTAIGELNIRLNNYVSGTYFCVAKEGNIIRRQRIVK